MSAAYSKHDIDRYQDQIAELLTALKKVASYLERWADEPECGDLFELARAAIAKAEGVL